MGSEHSVGDGSVEISERMTALIGQLALVQPILSAATARCRHALGYG